MALRESLTLARAAGGIRLVRARAVDGRYCTAYSSGSTGLKQIQLWVRSGHQSLTS